ncbi:MAG: (2Fe-2S)-binding protein [Thiobacillaceae bacterium]
MYVCVCQQVTDRDIHQAVAQGACRMRDLRKQLGVSSQCGKCAGCAKAVLQEARAACAHSSRLQPA